MHSAPCRSWLASEGARPNTTNLCINFAVVARGLVGTPHRPVGLRSSPKTIHHSLSVKPHSHGLRRLRRRSWPKSSPLLSLLLVINITVCLSLIVRGKRCPVFHGARSPPAVATTALLKCVMYRHQRSLKKVSGQDFKLRPVRDWSLSGGLDRNTKSTTFALVKCMLIIGPTINNDVPGFWGLSVIERSESRHDGLLLISALTTLTS